jgi:cytidylate kinase
MDVHNILHTVERQCRLWELQREAQRIEAVESWPVITISRQFGARGEAFARRLGERIGFAVWDNELVRTVAEEAGANEALFTSLDEHHRRAIDDAIEGALTRGKYANSAYLRRLMHLVHTIHSHGKSIIVGRGAQYILDPATTLRVRVVSPLEVRVKAYGARQGLTPDQARRHVEQAESERVAYIRQSFFCDINDPTGYDLLVNSGTIPLESLVGVVLAAYEAKFHRRPPFVSPPTKG